MTLLVAVAPTVQAAQLADYAFSGSSLDSTANPKNSSASTITVGPGLTDSTRFVAGASGRALRVGTDETDGTDFNTAANANDYFTFTLTPSSGYHFVFTNFSVDLMTADTTVLTNVELQASVDGGTTFTVVNHLTGYSSSTYATNTFDLTAANNAVVATGTAVVLRIVVYDNDSAAGNYTGFDNIIVNGALAVPEPGSVAMLALGAAAAGGVILRRRRR